MDLSKNETRDVIVIETSSSGVINTSKEESLKQGIFRNTSTLDSSFESSSIANQGKESNQTLKKIVES